MAMKVRLVQKSITDLDIARHLDQAASAGVELVLFGELGGTGCLYSARSMPEIASWQKLSSKYRLDFMIGVAATEPEGLRNSYLYFSKGNCARYDKINLFPGMGEDKVYRPGIEKVIWNTPFGKTGVTICYDIRFPELYAELTRMGATTILVPAAFPRVRINHWKELLVQRARENRVRVIGINSVGDDGTNVFGGSSTIVEPDGSIRFQADETNPVSLDFTL
jgi:omega-amidase